MSRRHALDDLDDEIRDYLEHETADNIARGMPPDAARDAARRKFGNAALTKEDARAVWIPVWIDQLQQDARYAFRMFRRTPVFSAVVMLTLALGIGLNTAVFGVINAVLLRPLAYQHPERLVWISTYEDRTPAREAVIAPDYLAWRDQATTLDRFAAFSIGTERIAAHGELFAARIATVSREFWDLAGERPELGRLPAPDEDAVVLSRAFFEQAFSGDVSVISPMVALRCE